MDKSKEAAAHLGLELIDFVNVVQNLNLIHGLRTAIERIVLPIWNLDAAHLSG